jgi:outer membrane protein assembly factor BamB
VGRQTGGATREKPVLEDPFAGLGRVAPLVIGRRVVVLNEPDLVVCYDANTGKELWRDRVELMTLPLLGADRRSL